jgi:hypothetical protein
MGIVYSPTKSGKTKRKPGWQKVEQEHAAWLASVSSQTFSGRSLRPGTKRVNPVVHAPVLREVSLPASRSTPGGNGTTSVHRPEILYRDNEELLARELAARQRKFNVAPAYNKGADQLVTEEELVNLLSSNKRRS